jgi:phosphopantetheinyl transferase
MRTATTNVNRHKSQKHNSSFLPESVIEWQKLPYNLSIAPNEKKLKRKAKKYLVETQ